MASTSNTTSNLQLEESAFSRPASAGFSISDFTRFELPTSGLAFQSDKRYDVFLSFRGPDVRNTLVDHLFEALSAAGLNVFLDSEKLEKGEIIDLSLEKAIETSVICIPIFSKGYADSAWCLREAAAMLNSSALIIPLFYHVDPSHVRYPLNDHSPYKQSFLKHYRHSEIEWWKHALVQICPCLELCCRSVRFQREEIDGWKTALREICKQSGWSMDLTGDFEAQLVKIIVKDLLKRFDKAPLEVAEHLIGLESMKHSLIQNLNLNSMEEVVKIGIWGMGGIGKTTVATALYNQIYDYFEAASFVFNVCTTAEEVTGLTTMQKQILEQLTKYDGEVYSVPCGKSLFRARLRGKHVLLILDGVDDVVQLNALLGDWLAPGSRVIITSRDKHILNVAQVAFLYEMGGLEVTKSLQLFSWNAFAKAFPPSCRLKDLSLKIVEACKGHPLSLEVIGSFLSDKQDDIGCWTEALQNISRIPHMQKRVYNTLKISYNALSDEEKEIFVDIACLFTGESTEWPIVFWKSLYQMVDTAVQNLSMKLLIKIDNKGHFYMHDHLRDMGRTIAEKENDCTLLWTAADLSTVPNNTNFSRLRLNGCNPQSLKILCTSHLRYLHLENLVFEDVTEKTLAMLPTSLIWLRLEGGANSRFVFSVFQREVIQLEGFSWFGRFPISTLFSLPSLSKLQRMDMALKDGYKLKFLPDTIGNLSNLQKLSLKGFRNLISLPDTIGNMSQLQYLDVRGCSHLEKLPDIIGKMSQLQYLDLGLCKQLENLPDTINNLSQLQRLDLRECFCLKNLPDTVGKMSQLQQLDLGFCKKLQNLPDTIGNLSQLQRLNLRGCFFLKNLPDTVGKMSQLQQLDLGFCKKLQNLPDTIGNLSQMQRLNLRGCFCLKSLPHTIGKLSQLQQLDFGFCNRLESVPDTIGNLSQLQHLDMRICVNLKHLPVSIGNLSQLKQLILRDCFGLNVLPDTIGNLTQVEYLDLERCNGLNVLPGTIGRLLQLKHLDLTLCDKLNNLPDNIGNLSRLLNLYLRGCNRLSKLPDTIGDLSQLQHLDLRGCNGLNNLPHTIGNLSQLQHLNLRGCKGLNNLPHTIGNLSQLRHLDLIQCDKLTNLADTISKLSQLQTLYWNEEGRNLMV